MTSFTEMYCCTICPRMCSVNRYSKTGVCGASAEIRYNLSQLHFGEEPPISGTKGSGTIFFSHCNLKCVFCQNHSISFDGFGQDISIEELASIMCGLQAQNAHNINLVSPTHYTPQIRESIILAKAKGLHIPIVWNSSGYEKVDSLASLEGLIDIYLPDFKYYHSVYAKKYSNAWDYPQVAMMALKEMLNQVGKLQLDSYGVAYRGLLLRLLVLPHGLSGTNDVLRLIADEIGTDIHLSLMAQYYPAGSAHTYKELARGLTEQEYITTLNTALELGFHNVFQQELSCSSEWTPDFVQDFA